MDERSRSLSRWWMAPVAGSVLLLAYNSPWFRLYYPDVYRLKQWVFGLHLEMNVAVCWSAMLFLLGAGLFWEAAGRDRALRRPYLELTLLMLVVAIDEVGSLHERVSGFGGWPSLAPFALVMAFLLVDGCRLLWRDRRTRPVARVVLAGFVVLASVAVQEYAEHNLTSKQWSHRWGRFLEEGTEIVGALVVLAGAVYARWRRWNAPAAAVVPDPGRMALLPAMVVAGLVAHLLAAQILYLPTVGPSRGLGSPAAVYPLALFFLLACYAFWMPRRTGGGAAPPAEVRGFWNMVGVYFLACSLGFVQNLWGLVGHVVPGLGKRHFYEPIPVWMLVVALAWAIGWILRRELGQRGLLLLALPLAAVVDLRLEHAAAKHLAAGLFACLCALAMLGLGRPTAARLQARREEHRRLPPTP